MSRYTLREEKANAFTHAIGIPFGLVVTFLLMQKALLTNNYWLICSSLVYALFMTFSYVTSTLYHSDKDENRKLLRRK
jgi:hemolysin III